MLVRLNPDRAAAIKLSRLLADFLGGKLDRVALAREMQRVAKAIEAEAPVRPPKTEDAALTEVVIRVHGAWCQVMDQKALLTAGRKQRIAARLKVFTEAQLTRAIRGCAASAHHMGTNESKQKYNSMELIFRNDEKVEFFLRIADEKGVSNQTVDRKRERLQRDADVALREGRLDDYASINDQLRAG